MNNINKNAIPLKILEYASNINYSLIKENLGPISKAIEFYLSKDKIEELIKNLENNISDSRIKIFNAMLLAWDDIPLFLKIQFSAIAYLTNKKDKPILSMYLAGLTIKTCASCQQFEKALKSNLE